ncbi:DNRLRE domain-containing protein [Streptomyces sp. NPDC002688]|uniref:DNRLRE domain-containing protein n=1 Tax=Streptomyces sp. NPDC002688 TaxID=3154423 RepID=UPI00332D8D08
MGIPLRIPRGRRAVALAATAVAAALGVGVLPLLDSPDTNSGAKKADSKTSAPLTEDTAQDKARRTGKRIEVTGLRTATTTTYALPDGRFEYRAHSATVRAKVGGTWQPIDPTLRRTRSGNWVSKATNNPVEFSGGTSAGRPAREAHPAALSAPAAGQSGDDTPLVTLTSEGHTMTLSWPGPLPEPVIQGSRALYAEVLPDVDLLLTARDSGFSHVLIVKTAEAAARSDLDDLRYKLSSPDLAFTIDPTTDAVYAKDADGHEIAVSPTPYVWDSAGKAAETQGDDSEPAAPTDEASPSYSEEPGAEVDEETDAPSDSLDTAAPTPGDEPEDGSSPSPETTEPSPAASEDDETADPAAYRPRSSNVTVQQAAFRQDDAGLSAAGVLELPGLAGPQPGSHAGVADASLDGDSDVTLHVRPDRDLMTNAATKFPLFIDPSFGHTENWTTAYNRYPTSSFWSGLNFNDGTSEARVGYEATTWGKSRSFFRLDWDSSLKGAYISDASLYALETYSWSCSGRVVQLWRTDPISSKTTWNNQPAWKEQIGSQDVAHGYNSSCRRDYVEFDAQDLAQDAADGAWSKITIGLRASDAGEDDAYAWKKFKAISDIAPYIKVHYNRKPKVPTSKTMTPGPDCDMTLPYATVGKSDLTFAATSSDPDDNLKYLDFEVWQKDHGDQKILDQNKAVDNDGHAAVSIASSAFHNGYTYSWRVRAIDDSGAASDYGPTTTPFVCRFVYDNDAPSSPDVTSTDFPAANTAGDVWSEVKFGTPGKFTFAPNGDKDVTEFRYSFNSTSYDQPADAPTGGSATITLPPPVAGPNILYVIAVDTAGNPSKSATKYLFYVTPKDVADKAGDTTGDSSPDLFVINTEGNLQLYPANAAGDLHANLDAAHRNGTVLADSEDEDGYWKSTSGAPALIAHGGDILPGDGITDLIARMPNGNLYAYPGDGYGSVNVAERISIRMPSGAPDPQTFTQIILGDYNLDKRPDLFATTETGGMWAFTGYTGATFTTATQIATSAWADRDLVSIGDHNADNAPDLVYRSTTSGNLYLRYGIVDSNGGSTIASLTTAAGSLNGTDKTYATGWTQANMPLPLLYGTPDVTNDTNHIPDIWTLTTDGSIKVYPGGSQTLGTGVTVISSASDWKTSKLAFG